MTVSSFGPDDLEARAERFMRANFVTGGTSVLNLFHALEYMRSNRNNMRAWAALEVALGMCEMEVL